jgi:hypothetical protein
LWEKQHGPFTLQEMADTRRVVQSQLQSKRGRRERALQLFDEGGDVDRLDRSRCPVHQSENRRAAFMYALRL